MNVINFLVIYFVCINIVAFFAFFIDKNRSKRAKWRIPESTLMSFAVFFGGLGCILGMYICHHKTRKPLFYIGIPVIIVLQVALVIFLLFFSKYNFTL